MKMAFCANIFNKSRKEYGLEKHNSTFSVT